jgi:hypothetical protein
VGALFWAKCLPGRQINQFRDNARGLGNAVELADLPGRIGARGHHEVGPPNVLGLAACLQPHSQFRHARLKTHLIGDHPFNGCNMSMLAAPGAALASRRFTGNGVTVHVKAHGNVVVVLAPES